MGKKSLGQCIDCKTELGNRRSKRCRRCAAAKRRKPPQQNHCVDCGEIISQPAKRCIKCFAEIRKKESNCPDCGVPVTKYGRRCRSCAKKMLWMTKWKNRRVQKPTCRDCGAIVSRKNNRCRSCAGKAQWEDKNHRQRQIAAFRKTYNLERRLQQSLISKKMWQNPEYREKTSAAIKKSAQSIDSRRKRSEILKAIWKNENHRQKVSLGVKGAHERGDFKDVQAQSPTSIEIAISATLDICGIIHESQYRPSGYSRPYDEFIPPNILIEIQGDYFHSEENFPGIMKRDAEKARWAKSNNFHFIEIWEHEINEYGAWAIIVQKVLPIVENKYYDESDSH